MKKNLLKGFMSFFLIALCAIVICQETTSPVKGIVAGTSRKYVVSFNSGQVITGKITSIDKEKIYIQEGSQNSQAYNLSDVIAVDEASSQYKASIGLGIGVSYGTIGINAEYFAHPNISLNLGVGTAIFVSPTINGGAKIYFTEPSKRWRPRASIYYGTNSIIFHPGDSYLAEISEKLNNLSFGIGQVWMSGSGNRGFDLDLMYLVHDGAERLENYVNQGYDFDLNAMGHIKINLGYHFYF